MRWLLDTNVLLDVLADRRPWVRHSAAVLSAVERGDVRGHVAAHAVTTLFYLIDRHRGPEVARERIRQLMQLVEVVPVDGERLLAALDLPLEDFEDAVHAACARSAGADALVTRDVRGFRGFALDIVTPVEALARLG